MAAAGSHEEDDWEVVVEGENESDSQNFAQLQPVQEHHLQHHIQVLPNDVREQYMSVLGDAFGDTFQQDLLEPHFEEDDFGDGDYEMIDEERYDANQPSSSSASRPSTVQSTQSNRKTTKTRRRMENDSSLDEDDASVLGFPDSVRRGRSPPRLGRKRKMPEELKGLIGQAAVRLAQGCSAEAIELVEEVIRQEPRHSLPYQQMALIQAQLGNHDKRLYYDLLAAHLDGTTKGDTWFELATMCEEQDKYDQAIVCYANAIKADHSKWEYYEAKIKLLETMEMSAQVIETKTQALRYLALDTNVGGFNLIRTLANQVAQKSSELGDTQTAIWCYSSVMERARLEKLTDIDDLELLVTICSDSDLHGDVVRAILTYSSDCTPLDSTGNRVDILTVAAVPSSAGAPTSSLRNGARIQICRSPSRDSDVASFMFAPELPIGLRGQLVIGLLRINYFNTAKASLAAMISDHRHSTDLSSDNDWYDWYVKVAAVLIKMKRLEWAEELIEMVIGQSPVASHNARPWYLYAQTLSGRGRLENACAAYKHTLELDPTQVDARIELSALHHRLGRFDEALEALQEEEASSDGPSFNDSSYDSVTDDRLLSNRLSMLYERRDWEGYLKTGRRLLAPYFYDVYQSGMDAFARFRKDRTKVGVVLRAATMDVVLGSNLERLVKRIGEAAAKQKRTRCLTAKDLRDICFRMCEMLFSLRRFTDLLYLACYSFQQPALVQANLSEPFSKILFMAAIHAKQMKVAFEFLRNDIPTKDRNKLWNGYALIFAMSQDVKYHKFTLRLTTKYPNYQGLAILSGNNSIVTGSYLHALAEYQRCLKLNPTDAYLNLMVGLIFIHLGCKKDISRRHDLCLQGLAYLTKYVEQRTTKGHGFQECYYNMGRALHQCNVLFVAIYFYNKVLKTEPLLAAKVVGDVDTEECSLELFDFRPLAAHNLSMIYMNSGNRFEARRLLEKYCTV